jgi:hypothetical protein
MSGPHTAENVLVAIQEILLNFTFNTNKISSVVCDEGSNLVRLFGSITSENNFYLKHVEEDIDDFDDVDYHPEGDQSSDDDDFEDAEDNDAASSDEDSEEVESTFV